MAYSDWSGGNTGAWSGQTWGQRPMDAWAPGGTYGHNLLGRLFPGFGGAFAGKFGGGGGMGPGGPGGGGPGPSAGGAQPPPAGSSAQDWAAYFAGGGGGLPKPPYTVSGGLSPTAASFLGGYAPVQQALLPQGYGTLASILQSQGATDPKLLNRTLNDISLGTSANQTAMQEQLAKYGLSGSGIGQALSGAIQQAGVGQRADVLANEAQLQEQRKRQDLQTLFQQLLLDPSFNILALERGQYAPAQKNTGPSNLDQLFQLGGTLGAAAIAACWVAAECFGGWDQPLTIQARRFVNRHRVIFAPYIKWGKSWASWLRRHQWAKPPVKVLFRAFAWLGRKDG